MENTYVFTSVLESSDNKLWGAHFVIPGDVFEALKIVAKDKRVVCKLNQVIEYQCAMLSFGSDKIVISVNKANQKKLKLMVGSQVEVSLKPDDSEYGLPIPEEFEEVLEQDEVGAKYFHSLTPGKKRTLLYTINQPKSSEGKIQRGLCILDHLVTFEGKIEYKHLAESLKKND
jgi:Bacteriocin-protection, YdeI or OmpD-Associated/Domain of unknown function (DUF1905)